MAIIQPEKEGRKNYEKQSKNGYDSHIIFQNEPKNRDRHAILCRFSDFMFINEGGMKLFVKRDERTHGEYFIISRLGPTGRREMIKIHRDQFTLSAKINKRLSIHLEFYIMLIFGVSVIIGDV